MFGLLLELKKRFCTLVTSQIGTYSYSLTSLRENSTSFCSIVKYKKGTDPFTSGPPFPNQRIFSRCPQPPEKNVGFAVFLFADPNLAVVHVGPIHLALMVFWLLEGATENGLFDMVLSRNVLRPHLVDSWECSMC